MHDARIPIIDPVQDVYRAVGRVKSKKWIQLVRGSAGDGLRRRPGSVNESADNNVESIRCVLCPGGDREPGGGAHQQARSVIAVAESLAIEDHVLGLVEMVGCPENRIGLVDDNLKNVRRHRTVRPHERANLGAHMGTEHTGHDGDQRTTRRDASVTTHFYLRRGRL